MSQHARAVIRSIDTAHQIHDRNPRLFSQLLRADRDTRQLEAALDRYRRQQRPVGGRIEHDEVERIDPQAEQKIGDRAAERWKRIKGENATRRRKERDAMSTIDLHRAALERAIKLSTVRAAAVGSSSPSSTHPSKNLALDRSGAQLVEDDPRWTESQLIIRRRVEKLHDLLDEYEGLGSAAQAAAAMDSYDKNARILKEGRGHPCDVVVDLLGREIAGSPRTVWRVRQRTHDPDSQEWKILGYAVSTIDGTPLESTPRGPIRRVVIEEDR